MKDSREKEFLETYLSCLEDRGETLTSDQPGAPLTCLSASRDGALLHHQGVHILPAVRGQRSGGCEPAPPPALIWENSFVLWPAELVSFCNFEVFKFHSKIYSHHFLNIQDCS